MTREKLRRNIVRNGGHIKRETSTRIEVSWEGVQTDRTPYFEKKRGRWVYVGGTKCHDSMRSFRKFWTKKNGGKLYK